MARYTVEAEVTVETNIEVDGNIEEPTSTDISNFDSGYFNGSETVEDTCTISFVWEPSETYEDNSEAEDAGPRAAGGQPLAHTRRTGSSGRSPTSPSSPASARR